ncbi:C40 family peptidase [Pontibacter rugosus]|uniref:NlpC/P60 family protein n=1 Tax=Pontibacter rugosus TaxID=1745966 RepID=A0ABW3SNP8_9BACT
MEYGIGMLSVVPMRAETSDKAEIVTQLLFGECYEVVAKEGNWLCLQLTTDGYRGWIDYKQHTPVSETYYQEWLQAKHPRVLDILGFVQQQEVQIPVGIGSYLPFFDGQNVRINDSFLAYSGRSSAISDAVTTAHLTALATCFLKFPYLWGGKSVFGIDCSGFTQQVFGICGYQLPRDAYQQVLHGEEVHFVTQAQPGDLAFFSNAEGRIVHVGIVMEEQKIIHAHGEVRIDKLDHNGIFNNDLMRYTHNLRIIKRISF